MSSMTEVRVEPLDEDVDRLYDFTEVSASEHRVFQHVPALDGLRGAAVAAVLLYHGSFLSRTWLAGGYLGVDLHDTHHGHAPQSVECRDTPMRRLPESPSRD